MSKFDELNRWFRVMQPHQRFRPRSRDERVRAALRRRRDLRWAFRYARVGLGGVSLFTVSRRLQRAKARGARYFDELGRVLA